MRITELREHTYFKSPTFTSKLNFLNLYTKSCQTKPTLLFLKFNFLSYHCLLGKSIIIFYLEQGCEIMDFIFPENRQVSGIENYFFSGHILFINYVGGSWVEVQRLIFQHFTFAWTWAWIFSGIWNFFWQDFIFCDPQ